MASTKTKKTNVLFDEALGTIRKYPRNLCEEVERIMQGLDTSLVDSEKDSETAYSVLPEAVNLAQVFGLPNISATIVESLLVVFRHVGQTYFDKYSIPESASAEYTPKQASVPQDSNLKYLRGKAFGAKSELLDALHYLMTFSESKPDSEAISFACSKVPITGEGSKVLDELKNEIKRLMEQEDTGASEDTEVRFEGIVYCHYLYHNLDSLWSFVFHYLVILCIAQGKSQSTAVGYLEVIEGKRLESVVQSKILFKPEAEFAGVAAVFNNGKWPKLKKYIERSLSFQIEYFKSLDGRKVKLVSRGNTTETFAMFRHPPENVLPFTQKKFVRVSKENHTIFYLELIENTHFVIGLDANRRFKLQINRKGNLVTDTTDTTDKSVKPHEKQQFNLVWLEKDIVMISCRRYPTCFVTMTCAQEDACLKTTNIGAGQNSQWKLEVLG